MLAAGQRIGDYVVETEVGGGGFATVFRVRCATDGALYAMKVLDPEHRKHEDRRMRFLDEARIQAKRLDHPNIVKVVEIVATHEVAALVLEYVDGGDLDDFIRSRTEPLSNAELLALAVPLLGAVGHAHSHGIIHRDLKPANILLARVDGQVVPKVTDFGVAKVLSDSAKKKQTATRAQIGTLGFMSPEQIKSPKDVTHKSDIFSLGAVLYELATGVEPFGGGSDYEVMDNVVNARYRRAAVAASHLPMAVGDAIDRALSPSPDGRFESCSDFAQALSTPAARPVSAERATVQAPASQPLPRSGPVPRFSAPHPVAIPEAAPPGASQTLKLGRPIVPMWLKAAGVLVIALVFYGMFRMTNRSAKTETEQPDRVIEPVVPGGCSFDGTWTLRFHDARGTECPLPTPYEVQFGVRQRGNQVTLTADPYEMFGNVASLGGDMDRHRARDSCTVFATTELRGEQIHFSVTESMGMLNGWAVSGAGQGKLDDGQCTIGGTRKKGVPVSARTPVPPPSADDEDDDEEHVSLDFLSLAVGVDECDEFFRRTVACMRRRELLTSSVRRTLIERVERTRSDIEASNSHSHAAVCRQAIRETRQVLKTTCAD